MDTKKILIILFVSFLFSCDNLNEMNTVVEGNEIELRTGDGGSYDFTIVPGTETWNQLVTEQERIDVLQVPEAILATLSPDDAVRLSITLPAFIIFTAWNTPQDGFNVMFGKI